MAKELATIETAEEYSPYKYVFGRPRKYTDIKVFTDKIVKYFELAEQGKCPLTICGLAGFLGFMDRQSLYDAVNREDEFSCVIKKAINVIETQHEANLQNGQCAGSIFWLKNRGWTDQPQVNSLTDNALSELIKQIKPSKGVLPKDE